VKQEQERRLRQLTCKGWLRARYIGKAPMLRGKTALLRYPEQQPSSTPIVLTQFDDLSLTPLRTHGWRQDAAKDFEVLS